MLGGDIDCQAFWGADRFLPPNRSFPDGAAPGPRLRRQRLRLAPEGAIARIFPKKRRRYPPRRGLSPRAQDASPWLIRRNRPARRTADARRRRSDRFVQAPRTSPRGTRQPQPADPLQNRREQLAGHRHLRQLEDDVLGVRHHLGPDLDQLLAQGGQVPAADRPRQHQLPQGVRQVVRHGCPGGAGPAPGRRTG